MGTTDPGPSFGVPSANMTSVVPNQHAPIIPIAARPATASSLAQPPSVTPIGSGFPVTSGRPADLVQSKSGSASEVVNVPSVGGMFWDNWPDGNFEMDFNWQEFADTKDLMVHWAYCVLGGDRKGDLFGDTWQDGKRAKRRCLGIIVCDDECGMIIRPQTKPDAIARQVLSKCRCGAGLRHKPCDVVSELWKHKKGVHYINGGLHNHSRPTHILHISHDQQAKFEAIIKRNPKVGSLGLLVGVPGLRGPEESVADISDVFMNADRIRKEQQRVRAGDSQGGDGFLAEFAKFARDHPGFVIYSQIGEVNVIIMQTTFMASQLVKNGILEGPVNGLISDAAHGFWRERTSILIVTSCHSPDLLCWVPVVFTYSSGSSAEHYKLHFLALFQSIAHQAEKENVPITDELFAGVCHIEYNSLIIYANQITGC